MFQDAAGNYDGSVISHNKIAGAGLDSIQIAGAGGVTVEDNDVSDCQFSGIYCMTGARNMSILYNNIRTCYGGVDVGWGSLNGVPDSTGRRTGPDYSEGIVVVGNKISKCVGGIGAASNGAIIANNTVQDCGEGAVQTYTLGVAPPTIISGGQGYKVDDVVVFVGPSLTASELAVKAVDENGAITAVAIYIIGVYVLPPPNPIAVSGGAGTGASFRVATWNKRGFLCNGIGITDARNCIISNNVSGNSSGNAPQKVGFIFNQVYSPPNNTILVGNDLWHNADYPYVGKYAGRYVMPYVGTGHIIRNNK
jgi:hypothetical protein